MKLRYEITVNGKVAQVGDVKFPRLKARKRAVIDEIPYAGIPRNAAISARNK